MTDENIAELERLARALCETTRVDKDYNDQIAGTLVTDSGAITSRATALRTLANFDKFRIVAEFGRMVVGYWPENDPKKC